MTELSLDLPDDLPSDLPPGELGVAIFGKQVDMFWDSDIGQYLLKRALAEYNSAISELIQVHPTDVGKIAQLQMKATRAEQFREWLSAAIQDGIRATRVLEGQEE